MCSKTKDKHMYSCHSKGEKSEPWRLQCSGLGCSHRQEYGRVCTLSGKLVLSPSSGPGLGQGQSRNLEAWSPLSGPGWSGTGQIRGKMGMLGGFSLPLLSDPRFTTVDLWQPRLICLRCGSPAADPETNFHVKRQERFPGKLSWGWGEVGRGREGHTKQSPWKLCLSLAGTSTNSVGFTWGLFGSGREVQYAYFPFCLID